MTPLPADRATAPGQVLKLALRHRWFWLIVSAALVLTVIVASLQTVFAREHNRLVEHTKTVVLADAQEMLDKGASQAEAVAFLNEWLAVAPQAEVAHGQTGCLVSLTIWPTAPLLFCAMVQ